MHGRLRLNYSMWFCFLENGFWSAMTEFSFWGEIFLWSLGCASGVQGHECWRHAKHKDNKRFQPKQRYSDTNISANMLRMRRFIFPHQSQNLNVCKIYNSFIEQHPQTSLTHITLPLCTAVQCELIYNTLQYKYKTHQIQVVGRWGRQQ